jgi:signal peptidase I
MTAVQEPTQPGSDTGTERDVQREPAPIRRRGCASILRWILESILLIAFAYLVATGVKNYVVQPFVIPTGSMIPSIEINDYILAEKISFRFIRDPRPGDIVVFDDPGAQHPQLIKRVIAGPGQIIDIRDRRVFVDGKPVAEPYVYGKPTAWGTVALPLTVPEGQVWLMGDNRPNSSDSRFFGAQPIKSVRGRAFWTYWPMKSFGSLD